MPSMSATSEWRATLVLVSMQTRRGSQDHIPCTLKSWQARFKHSFASSSLSAAATPWNTSQGIMTRTASTMRALEVALGAIATQSGPGDGGAKMDVMTAKR